MPDERDLASAERTKDYFNDVTLGRLSEIDPTMYRYVFFIKIFADHI